MNNLSPFDFERILLAHLLIYPESVKYVMPQLSHDKFLYSKEGSLESSKDHLRIFQAMTYLHLVDKAPITIPSVLMRMGESKGNSDFLSYLTSLELALPGYYRIREYDPRTIMGFADLVDKAGIAYQAAVKSYGLTKIIQSPEEFAKAVTQDIGDVTEWLHNHVSNLSSIVTTGKPEGYKHIGEDVSKTIDYVERLQRGEQLTLLPVGMPSIMLPLGKLVVVQGESNSGKSLISHQWALGAAIGLKHHNVKGSILINSLEEDADDLRLKLAGQLATVDLADLKYGNGISKEAQYRLTKALEYIACLPLYIDNTNTLAASVMQFRAEGLHASDAGPVWHINIDYLELLANEDADSLNKEQSLDRNIHKCFEISRTIGANVLVISQITLGTPGTNPKFRIAGPDGARYSKAIRHAADLIYEWVNYPELKKAGIEPACPDGLNTEQPFLLCEKHRGGPKYSPVGFIWEPEYLRVGDPMLNQSGNPGIVLFNWPIPSFEEVEAGSF
jgi:replicative DNA helicase